MTYCTFSFETEYRKANISKMLSLDNKTVSGNGVKSLNHIFSNMI